MHLFPILLLAASWISGQVVYILPHTSPTNGLFVINDEHSRRIVISNARKPPLVGDIVRFRTSGQDSPWSVVDTFEVLGHRQPPAPQAIPLSDVRAERYQLKLVRVQGILVDAFKDEIDSAWNWLLLRARGVTVPIAWSGDADSLRHATSLIGAEISVDGCSMPQHRGQRLFLSSLIEFNDFSSVKVLRPVEQNLTNAPPISLTSAWQPDGLQSVVGRVTACWGKGNVFLLTEKDRTLQVSLRQTVGKPALGTAIRAVGFAEMNSFFLSMRQAEWSPHATDLKTPEQPVLRPSARDLSADDDGYLNTKKRGVPVHMVNTRLDGTYVQERTMTHSTRVVKNELDYEKFDFHSLRHTHATELSEAGVNIKEIQRRLGHSTMDVTSKRYLHATKAMEDESIEKMNRMFG